jgi:hypothetical protein
MSPLAPEQMSHFIESRKYNYSSNNNTTELLQNMTGKYVDGDGYDPFVMHFDVKKANAIQLQDRLEQRAFKDKMNPYGRSQRDRPLTVKWA